MVNEINMGEGGSPAHLYPACVKRRSSKLQLPLIEFINNEFCKSSVTATPSAPLRRKMSPISEFLTFPLTTPKRLKNEVKDQSTFQPT